MIGMSYGVLVQCLGNTCAGFWYSLRSRLYKALYKAGDDQRKALRDGPYPKFVDPQMDTSVLVHSSMLVQEWMTRVTYSKDGFKSILPVLMGEYSVSGCMVVNKMGNG